MSEIRKPGNDFIGYEYQEKVVPGKLSSFYLDSYACFGWEPDPNRGWEPETNSKTSPVHLHFRRNRKICNKVELTRLQRNFDGCADEIHSLERAKTFTASIWAIVVGILGTAFMAGSVFAVTAEPPNIPMCVIWALPGFAGWIIPYFLYKRKVFSHTKKLTPLIEQKYDEIYGICEKGNRLLI